MDEAIQSFAFKNTVPWTSKFQMLKNGVPVDLTGASLRMQLRVTPSSDEVAADFSTDNGRLVLVTPSSGIWSFAVSQIDATQIAAATYVQDMIVTLADGTVFSAFEGNAVISQGITRAIQPWQMMSV